MTPSDRENQQLRLETPTSISADASVSISFSIASIEECMGRHIDGVLQLTHGASLHSIVNIDSLHERVTTTPRTPTTLSKF